MMYKRLISALALIGAATNAYAFDWVDDSISWFYGPYYREPGLTSPQHPGGVDVGKNTIEFTHTDGWKYGTNFFDAQMIMSNRVDPAVSTNHQAMGAYEAYVVYRSDISLNALTGSKKFEFGPFSDIGINAGFDWDTKNNYYASGKLSFQIGPSFHVKVPNGFWQMSVGVYKEYDNDGYYGPLNYHATWTAASSWNIPFTVGVLPLSLQGYINVIGPKGYDYNNGTKTEVLFHPKLMLDVGQLMFQKKNWIEAGIGWEYWYHKYGASTSLGGAIQSTPFIEAKLHF